MVYIFHSDSDKPIKIYGVIPNLSTYCAKPLTLFGAFNPPPLVGTSGLISLLLLLIGSLATTPWDGISGFTLSLLVGLSSTPAFSGTPGLTSPVLGTSNLSPQLLGGVVSSHAAQYILRL